MTFINDDFLLNSEPARVLFHEYAKRQPIIDYHCHLSPADLEANRQFDTLFDIWLAGDHYKWRAMRLNGEAERYCTGDAEPYEKFLAYARTVPKTIRNPLFHWTHLELKRYFGIDTLLNEDTAPAIWDSANAQLRQAELSAWGIAASFKVEMVGTTDDPTDDLAHHKALAGSTCPAKVLPSFRPDKGFAVDKVEAWNVWTDQLAAVSGEDCSSLDGFLRALEQRIETFAAMGCVAADHGIPSCPRAIGSDMQASVTFEEVRAGRSVSARDAERFTGFLLCWLGERYAEKRWVMQFHLGALRNANQAMFEQLGPDIGCDSIDDRDQVAGLAATLGELSARGRMPKVVLYNLDPAKNYALATLCGNFFEAGVPGKMQFGSGWWFLDQLEGMTWQLNALSNLGLLGNFVGMLTDSRSFMSFPRHEYFRRLLCRLIGAEVVDGQIPDDMDLLGKLVADVSYHNAARYFGLG